MSMSRKSWLAVLSSFALVIGILVGAFRSQNFGWGVAVVLVLAAGLANAGLGIRDPKIGASLGSLLSMLVFSTLFGSETSLLLSVAFAGLAWLVGYCFGAKQVTFAEQEDGDPQQEKFKSGKGGDFGGGGANDKF